MVELCHRDVDEFGIPDERALSIMVPIFKGKCDTRNCSCHRSLKPLQRVGGTCVRKKTFRNSDR